MSTESSFSQIPTHLSPLDPGEFTWPWQTSVNYTSVDVPRSWIWGSAIFIAPREKEKLCVVGRERLTTFKSMGCFLTMKPGFLSNCIATAAIKELLRGSGLVRLQVALKEILGVGGVQCPWNSVWSISSVHPKSVISLKMLALVTSPSEPWVFYLALWQCHFMCF